MLASLILGVALAVGEGSAFEAALRNAEDSLSHGNLAAARDWIERALERDAKSPQAWDLRARWAAAVPDRDEEVYSRHQELRLASAQRRPGPELASMRARLLALDPDAADLLDLSRVFVARLQSLAAQYEGDRRPHSAIRVHKEILALDPERAESAAAIQRLASAPDPSLAADAKPKDLLAGVSEEWIRARDAEHATWEKRDRIERDNYVTHTNAGYAVLLRSAEAMEQMNAFYRQFFRYGTEEDGKTVPKIELHIFRKREEYLKLGQGPPVEWSGGHFTGSAVETYIGDGSFADMVGTLFHEAAHQFVSLATGAAGWLNEGLASFFEGCRILPNGTVLMNLPANHRLFPLVERMEKGWMSGASDGIDPKDPSKSEPEKAPTFRIVLENEYAWGPPWYAPTWGVVYFLYNYQDPVDGRFVYRAAFGEFVDKSGGRSGKGAVENFEEVVLARPEPPLPGVARPKGAADVRLPRTCAELDPVWKDWLAELKREQNGEIAVERPWLRWARAALKARQDDVAREHLEKGLVATPADPELLLEFAGFLAARKNRDRASKLALEAVRILEARTPPDDKAVRAAERSLEKWDPARRSLEAAHKELWAAARALVQRYADARLPMMVMDLSWRMSSDLRVPGLLEYYAAAVRQTGKSVAQWQLAYNEKNLDGWSVPGDSAFAADGRWIASRFRSYAEGTFDFQMLTLDALSSGDYSLEAEVLAEPGQVAFCGLVFGKKDASNFHGLMLFPGRAREGADAAASKLAASGFVDLASSYGGGVFKTWRHVPVAAPKTDPDETRTGTWRRLRVDVSGAAVDCWFDGQYLTTQEFPSPDVLRGGFGLITGPGVSRFGEVRFLSRPARDPAAAIEREVRMETLRLAAGEGAGIGASGSFLGLVPPFPKAKAWVQGSRSSFADRGVVPQLLVLWSTEQNDIVRIDPWLRGLAEKHADVGLEVLSVASPNDEEGIAAYLEEHAFPGAVAVDAREGVGIGDTFTDYFVQRFNLPRLLLLDVDRKVAWEGDPGFKAGESYGAGSESFLDAPLEELIARRKLRELAAWLPAWRDQAAPALARGDLALGYEVLKRSTDFAGGLLPAVDEAQRKLAALERALGDLPSAAAELAEEEAEPALAELLAFAPVAKKALDKSTRAALLPWLEGQAARDWAAALGQCERVRNRARPEDRLRLAPEALSRIEKLSGRFPRELAAELAPLVQAGDLEALQRLLGAAAERPRRWLVESYLRW